MEYLIILLLILILNEYASGDIILNGKYYEEPIRFKYKPIYGLDGRYKCPKLIYSDFEECEMKAKKEWEIMINDYFYETKKFCCFIWSALDCETEVANKCNQNFSQSAKKNTIDCFRNGCNKFSYGSCYFLMPIEITALGIIVICFLAFRPRSAKIDQNLAKISDNKIINKKMQLANKDSTSIENITSNTPANENIIKNIEIKPNENKFIDSGKISIVDVKPKPKPEPDYFRQFMFSNTKTDSSKNLEVILVPPHTDLSELQGPSWRVFIPVPPTTPPITPPTTPPTTPTVIAEAAQPLLDGAIQTQII
ncbi:hypothetical protein DERP_006832 [Dermatophagoides pteronyssinus]|uniref:Uncharacterized protein n=2 Tax=Dermatophagoides pteronyssinus TaxID=6956 RepID=A0ABQ8IS49_DERPT|nr:hypothetical protein DERP_006832 [Dermatophagoides pteronyssinus]